MLFWWIVGSCVIVFILVVVYIAFFYERASYQVTCVARFDAFYTRILLGAISVLRSSLPPEIGQSFVARPTRSLHSTIVGCERVKRNSTVSKWFAKHYNADSEVSRGRDPSIRFCELFRILRQNFPVAIDFSHPESVKLSRSGKVMLMGRPIPKGLFSIMRREIESDANLPLKWSENEMPGIHDQFHIVLGCFRLPPSLSLETFRNSLEWKHVCLALQQYFSGDGVNATKERRLFTLTERLTFLVRYREKGSNETVLLNRDLAEVWDFPLRVLGDGSKSHHLYDDPTLALIKKKKQV